MCVIACLHEPRATFVMRGSSGSLYNVVCHEHGWTCSCPDSARAQVFLMCKHRCFLAMLLLTPYQQTKFFAGQHNRSSHVDLSWRFKRMGRNTECPCCLNELHTDTQVCTKCQQGFHTPCILRWMKQSTACPMCRQTFSVIAKFSASSVNHHADSRATFGVERGVAMEQT